MLRYLMCLVFVSLPALASQEILICHFPANSGGEHTISVSVSSLEAHLEHGDYIGTCESDDDAGVLNDSDDAGSKEMDAGKDLPPVVSPGESGSPSVVYPDDGDSVGVVAGGGGCTCDSSGHRDLGLFAAFGLILLAIRRRK